MLTLHGIHSFLSIIKKRLQKMHNKMVRFISNMSPRTSYWTEGVRVGMLSVKDRVIQMIMNHVFIFFQGTAPVYLTAIHPLHPPTTILPPMTKGHN